MIFIIFAFLLTGCYADASITFELREGVDTVAVGSVYEDPGVIAEVNGMDYHTEVTENTVDTSEPGIYRITYSLTHFDHTETLTRIVTVIDDTPPDITINPGTDTVIVGDTWHDARVTVEDATGEDVTVETRGSVDTTTAGTYTITYVATDEYGNESRATRIVTVIDPRA